MEGILYVLTLMLRHQVVGVLPLLGQGTTVVYLPAPCPLTVAPHDFGRAAELIDVGYATARAFLGSGLSVGAGGVFGHPHHHPPGEQSAVHGSGRAAGPDPAPARSAATG